MDQKVIAIVVGGLLPAVLLGIYGVFQKASVNAGIAPGPFLVVMGVTTIMVGGVVTLLERDSSIQPRSAAYTAVCGLLWALGTAGIALAIRRFNGQVSQLAPLYNMNTLITVGIGLLLLAEGQVLNGWKLTLAAILIVIGGVLAATS